MTTPQITIHNALTGETIIREMNAAELAQLNADKIQADKNAETLAKAQADKLAKRAAVMTRLGITSDELDALLS
jgi:hypothetical protein